MVTLSQEETLWTYKVSEYIRIFKHLDTKYPDKNVMDISLLFAEKSDPDV